MKLAATATTLLFATLALASPAPAPAPAAQPEAAAIQAPRAVLFESAEGFHNALTERNADAMPNSRHLEARKKKKPKYSSSDSNNNSTNSTSGVVVAMTPSRALQLGAAGLGVMEVVRLWG